TDKMFKHFFTSQNKVIKSNSLRGSVCLPPNLHDNRSLKTQSTNWGSGDREQTTERFKDLETFWLFCLGAFLVKNNKELLANKEILLYYW
ncbi:hypothetical protein J5690_02410, partial [bacterium]|nr:hypothetical protein [bacterium]